LLFVGLVALSVVLGGCIPMNNLSGRNQVPPPVSKVSVTKKASAKQVEKQMCSEDNDCATDSRCDQNSQCINCIGPCNGSSSDTSKRALTGLWSGQYGDGVWGHGKEVVRITQVGQQVVATKVTGDVNVPAGKITFRATLRGKIGKGEGQIAETSYMNPQFVPGVLLVHSRDKIEFFWDNHGSVIYSRMRE
jgi:hypothetical protein